MSKIKEIFRDKQLYLFGLITLIFFGIFILMQYAPDTYFVFSSTTDKVIQQFFSCGRFVTGVAAAIFKGSLNLKPIWIYNISYTFAIICTIASLYALYKLVNRDIKNKTICVILSTLVVINIFSFELFVYIEKGIMMFSVLMCILAVEQVDKLLQSKKWKHFIWSILYMVVATCSYQGTVGIFVAISLIYILKYSKTIKEFLINNLKVALIYGIPAIINFVLVRFTSSNSRVEGNIVLSESVTKIIQGIKDLMINSYDLFPKYVFILAILAVIVFAIYKLLRSKTTLARDMQTVRKEKLIKGLAIVYIIAGTLFATVAPQILQNTDSIWFVARSSYPMASVIGILLIYILSNFEVNNIEKNIIITTSCIYMIIQLICFTTFAIDGYIVNYQDKQQANQIINLINQYEEQTGNQVTKIAFYQDKYTSYVYPDIKAYGDINIRAFSKDWVAISIINYYSGRQLEMVESDEELKQNLKEMDWQEFSQEQIILENNTINICLY